MNDYQATILIKSEMPYAALRKTVNQQDIPTEIPPLIGVLAELLQKENIKISGDCFFRYLSCTKSGQITIDVGFPIDSAHSKPEHIQFGSFPDGKYASVMHTGDYKQLMNAHVYLEKFIKSNNLTADEQLSDDGIEWGCRVEVYMTEPDTTPVEEWKTEVLFLLK